MGEKDLIETLTDAKSAEWYDVLKYRAVVLLSYKLTEKDVAAIEKGLNKGGKTEVVVRVVKEQLEVVLHEKKKIS